MIGTRNRPAEQRIKVLLHPLTLLLCCQLTASSFASEAKSWPVRRLAPIPLAADFKGDVRDLPYIPETKPHNIPEWEGPEPSAHKQALAGAARTPEEIFSPLPNMPSPSQSILGMDLTTWGAGFPPDTVGDVGASHYIQAVNTSIAIFNKTGTRLTAFTFNSLWAGAGSGTPCDTTNNGDPTVVYDSQANRWFIADFAWTNLRDGPYYECIAVSKTNDPVAGGWFLYAIRADDAAHPWLPDYPKMGIWPDGLYMSANMFDITNAAGAATYKGIRAYAFNRTDLESGVPVHIVIADVVDPNRFTVIPSNFRGAVPPAGRENLFVGESNTAFAWEVYKFHAVYGGAGSTFTGPTNVTQTAYNFGGTGTIPSPINALDSLRDRAMMQNQYRNLSGTESLWVNHTVLTGDLASPYGIQWAQINVTGGTINITPVQQQIFGNLSGDTIHRWMGSLAVDRAGNMALGYSAANLTNNPSIRYAGRLSTDPLSQLTQGEATLISGTGTQQGNCGTGACIRWGDYSGMSVDPVDDCTFWYTNEYYAANGLNWQTRIGSFRYTAGQCASRGAGEPAPILLSKSGGNLVISWTAQSANCGTQDYALYKGTISSPFAYNHAPVTCTTANLPSVTIPMPADNLAYFVVTSESGFDEGSYGRASTNVERPVGSPACRPLQTIGVCQ